MIDEFGLVRMKWLNEHKKKIDSEYFIQEILEKHVVIWNGFQKDSPKQWIFQQDNAPIHGSTMTTEYLEDQNIENLEWPSRSPDLSPIENIWPWLKIGVAKKRSKLKTGQDIWNELDRLTDLPEFTELCINCCKSFENRLKECVKSEGFMIDY